ncbi:natural killer cells antigen CD94-like [Xiphophorus couchianus]|uniref:natural killer cells antigen CD94-like n=1 Tax=Xiphophorus couchianus TaxID=32473 RepID=UPI0010167239|nr:natural killer cells antigen CD94-like [Xiphophorus couchianus]
MKSKEDNDIYSTVNIRNEKPSPESRAEEETSTPCRCSLMLLCSLIFSALLAARIVITMHINVMMIKQQETINNVTTENERLIEERKIMEDQNKELNRTLGLILKFENIPAKDLCPNKECKACQKNWILFQKKCYFFYSPHPWLTWSKSRDFCQDKHADLVVIDDQKEQEFVSNHTKYYYDNDHGYWMGLQQTNNNWIWVDGQRDTLGFWVKENLRTSGPKALLIPKRKFTESWAKAGDGFANKFICEREALLGFM